MAYGEILDRGPRAMGNRKYCGWNDAMSVRSKRYTKRASSKARRLILKRELEYDLKEIYSV